jgi:hypothetical protein
MSSFFDTPAGKALYAVGQGGGAGPQVPAGAGDDLFGAMRPSLRNTIADEYGSNLLRGLERRKPSRIEYADGPAAGAFGDRPEFYIPETDDPIAAMETARQQARRNFDVDEPMEAERHTGALRREAEGVDYGAELAGKRYWDPRTMSAREDAFRRSSFLATEPARLAGDARVEQALSAERARVQAAGITAGGRNQQELIRSFDDMVRNGAFGLDAKGMPLQPPPAVANFFQQFLGRTVGAAGQFSPEIEDQIARGLQAGLVTAAGTPATREDIIQHLRQSGKIQ